MLTPKICKHTRINRMIYDLRMSPFFAANFPNHTKEPPMYHPAALHLLKARSFEKGGGRGATKRQRDARRLNTSFYGIVGPKI